MLIFLFHITTRFTHDLTHVFKKHPYNNWRIMMLLVAVWIHEWLFGVLLCNHTDSYFRVTGAPVQCQAAPLWVMLPLTAHCNKWSVILCRGKAWPLYWLILIIQFLPQPWFMGNCCFYISCQICLFRLWWTG